VTYKKKENLKNNMWKQAASFKSV